MSSIQKTSMALQLLRDAEEKISTARQLLSDGADVPVATGRPRRSFAVEPQQATNVIEGVFDGQSMIGADKKIYPVPANYASKSKLVEGDTLKLTIVEDGSFIYKQIGPVERKHVRGVLERDERGEYHVTVSGNDYKVLLASVTYFKGMPNDEVTLIVPASGQATWGAIENIIKTTSEHELPDLVRESMERLKDSASEEPDVSSYDPSDAQTIPVAQVEEKPKDIK
jgi:hypothetical protein